MVNFSSMKQADIYKYITWPGYFYLTLDGMLKFNSH